MLPIRHLWLQPVARRAAQSNEKWAKSCCIFFSTLFTGCSKEYLTCLLAGFHQAVRVSYVLQWYFIRLQFNLEANSYKLCISPSLPLESSCCWVHPVCSGATAIDTRRTGNSNWPPMQKDSNRRCKQGWATKKAFRNAAQVCKVVLGKTKLILARGTKSKMSLLSLPLGGDGGRWGGLSVGHFMRAVHTSAP